MRSELHSHHLPIQCQRFKRQVKTKHRVEASVNSYRELHCSNTHQHNNHLTILRKLDNCHEPPILSSLLLSILEISYLPRLTPCHHRLTQGTSEAL